MTDTKNCVCGHPMTAHEWKHQWVCHRCGRTAPLVDDCVDKTRIINKLRELEAIAYGYNINGEVLGMDCSDFEQLMVDAANLIEFNR